MHPSLSCNSDYIILGSLYIGLFQRVSLELALNDVAERGIARFLSLAAVPSPGERALSLTGSHSKKLLLLCRLAKSLVPAATIGGGLIKLTLVDLVRVHAL